MPPDPTLPPSPLALLEKLGTFTSPSLRTFVAMVTGLPHGHREAHGDLNADSGGAVAHLVARSDARLLRLGVLERRGAGTGAPDADIADVIPIEGRIRRRQVPATTIHEYHRAA